MDREPEPKVNLGGKGLQLNIEARYSLLPTHINPAFERGFFHLRSNNMQPQVQIMTSCPKCDGEAYVPDQLVTCEVIQN
jgi:hypothetical protein